MAGADNNVEKAHWTPFDDCRRVCQAPRQPIQRQLTTRGLCSRGPSDGRPNFQGAGICGDDTSVRSIGDRAEHGAG